MAVGAMWVCSCGAHPQVGRHRHSEDPLSILVGQLTGIVDQSTAAVGLETDIFDDGAAGERVTGTNRSAELQVSSPGAADYMPVPFAALDPESLVDGECVHAARDEAAEVPFFGGAVLVNVEELWIPLVGERHDVLSRE